MSKAKIDKLTGVLQDAWFNVSKSRDQLIVEKGGHKISYPIKKVNDAKQLTHVYFEIEEMMNDKIRIDGEAV